MAKAGQVHPATHNTLLLLLAAFTLFLAIPAYPQSSSARDFFAAGSEEFSNGEFFSAIEQYKLALELNPRYVDPIAGLGEAYFFLAEFGEALLFVLEAEKLDASNVALRNLEGRIRIGLGQHAEAGEIFREVLAVEPNNVDSWFGMAELDLAFGNSTQAVRRYERALEIAPQNRRALLSLILVLDDQQLATDAAFFVDQALSFHPANPQVRFVAAKHHFARGEVSDSAFHARKVLELDPGHTGAAMLLGDIYLSEGEYARAVTEFENLLRSDRDQPLVWYGIGTAFRRLERVDEAMNAFGFALRYQADDEIARISLEQLMIEELGMDDARRAQLAQFHFDRGLAYQERNFLDRALRSYRRGLLMFPRSKAGRLLYADTFRIQGFSSKYLNELNVLLDLGYEDSDIADSVEIQESLAKGRVSDAWGVDQYTLFRQDFTFDLFAVESELLHFEAESDLASFVRSAMLHREEMRVPRMAQIGAGYGEAFAMARQNKSDYFILMKFVETTRHFEMIASMYSSKTGGELAPFQVVRTGNYRVADSINLLVEQVSQLLPISATILDRRFDSLLIDVGSVDGVSPGDELVIVKKNELALSTDRIGYVYSPEDVLGQFVVGRTDELISEGILSQSRFFDLINIGDRLLYEVDPTSIAASDIGQLSNDLYQTIRQIR